MKSDSIEKQPWKYREEMDRFLQAYGLPKLNEAYINNIDITAVNKTETVIKSILTKKTPEPGQLP